ncbi:hypothetical protein FA95DRAFT_582332 [Auriscalpium vulgare]|uniref:Uncharacterized protein n=1 Tax=Auriscalpium vulgare TaxID=40419 RepID=A0ACB8REC4_9AGAM|nr:hypothetical protein FA95DRAFT_582332 [Auriscalpium vulgare]
MPPCRPAHRPRHALPAAPCPPRCALHFGRPGPRPRRSCHPTRRFFPSSSKMRPRVVREVVALLLRVLRQCRLGRRGAVIRRILALHSGGSRLPHKAGLQSPNDATIDVRNTGSWTRRAASVGQGCDRRTARQLLEEHKQTTATVRARRRREVALESGAGFSCGGTLSFAAAASRSRNRLLHIVPDFRYQKVVRTVRTVCGEGAGTGRGQESSRRIRARRQIEPHTNAIVFTPRLCLTPCLCLITCLSLTTHL